MKPIKPTPSSPHRLPASPPPRLPASPPHRFILTGLIILLSACILGLAVSPTRSAQANAFQATATPTPAPGSSDPTANSIQQLTGQIQNLDAGIQNLRAEVRNLKAEIQILKSKIQNLIGPPSPNKTLTLLEDMAGRPCSDDSDFTCVTLTVPLDHFDPANRQTTDVVFGVLPASGERKGIFVTATGGPGVAGLTSADSYTAGFDPAIPEHFDIVFFDQRGVGQSGGLTCPEAAVTYYQTETETDTPADEAATITAAKTFSEACLAELDSPDKLLPYLGTHQAVEDLELFRLALDDDKIWLYGESYGTQFAQTYAAAHPDHLAALLLDGTVDLTLSGPEFMQQQAQAFNDVLVMTLEACNQDDDCAADMGQDALAAYDDLAAKLAKEPLAFTFPLPSGGTAKREFTLADLEVAASNYLYSEGPRMLLQRALAAADQADLVPLARLLYDSLGVDPETLVAIPDPTWSDAIYFAVECQDYEYNNGNPAQSAESYIRAGDAVDAVIPRLSSIFYGDLPCAFWPSKAAPRPAPLVAEGIPTLVLGATADPATPVSNGQQVYSRLADGYLITTAGGDHVIFGRGDACPDELVTAFLVEDKLPDQRETTCEGFVADAYVPLAPADAADFANPLEALLSADTEINYLPEYYNWDGETDTSVGCPHGGTLAFTGGDEGNEFTLTGCAFSAGLVLTGTGSYNYDLDSFGLDVGVLGPQNVSGDLHYERDENGAIHLTGEYDGQTIDLTEPDATAEDSAVEPESSAEADQDSPAEADSATAEATQEATSEDDGADNPATAEATPEADAADNSPTAEATEDILVEPTATAEASTGPAVPVENPTIAALEQLGGQPCPDNEAFTCVKLTVPLDHFDAANLETIEILFAVLPASGERKGMFVTANGGPGISGVAYADSYDYIDPRLAENFDIVHYDLRGVAGSGGFQCADADAVFYQADWNARTPAEEANLLKILRTFAADCVKETGVSPDKLRYYSTRQAIEDLELFRQVIGDDKFWLYGLSYGTQYGQTYAAVYPNHLAGLIIDGVVDLTLTGPEYSASLAQKDNDILVAILEACNADAACSADMGGDALAFYDTLAAELTASPQPFTFPLPSGETVQRQFTLADLESAAASYLYPPDARMLFLRALAATARDADLVPLIRLIYSPLSIDPETLSAIPDPTWSDAMYYMTTCNDYTYSGTPEQKAETFLRAGDAIEATTPRLASVFYGDMACVFWPEGEANPARPAPLVAEGVPTLVVGATADPTTPVEQGEHVYERLADGYLITAEGGSHVMFGDGNACIDQAIVAFLVEDKLPEQRDTRCEATLVDDYIQLSPANAADFADPLEALVALETEINYLPEYYYWDGATPTSVGCPHGGTLAFEPGDEGTLFTLTDCAFAADYVLTGSGTTDDIGQLGLDVSVSGPQDTSGTLTYQRDEDGIAHVSGEYNGQEIDLSE